MKELSERQKIERNLHDAGFNEEMILPICELIETRKNEEVFSMLKRQKCKLLEQLHTNQKEIDCLDYLMYDLREKKEKINQSLSVENLHE